MLRKRLLAGLLVVLLLGTSAIGFAYWDNLSSSQSGTITLGEGDTITVSESSAGSGTLIPSSITATGSEVTSIEFVYSVAVNQQAVDAGNTTLTVTESNVLIGGSSTYASLVNFSVTGVSTLSTSAISVTVTVTLTEPSDVTAYNAIINQDITFDLGFTASA